MSDERAKFEVWLREKWPGHPIVSMNFPDGSFEYKSAGAQHKWEGWQAAIAQVSPPADESVQMDARRLDWLEKNRETVYLCSHQDRVPCTDGFRRYELRYVFDGWAVRTDDEPKPTPRAAIDAAMSLAAMAKGD